MSESDIVGPTPLPPAATAEDLQWLTLCVYQEARGELLDGKAAVAKVVLNRARHTPPYASDGTIKGTVFWPNQFSWTSWAYVAGHYIKVAKTDAEVAERAQKLLLVSQSDEATWWTCRGAALAVLNGTYVGGAGYQALGADALLYVNLAVSRPTWADPAKLICRIGGHCFYRP